MATRISKAQLESRAVRLADHLDELGFQVADELRKVDLKLHTAETLSTLITELIFQKSGGKTPSIMRSFLLGAITKPASEPLVFAKSPTTILRTRATEMATKAVVSGSVEPLEASEALMKDFVQKQVDVTQKTYRKPFTRLRLILSSKPCEYCTSQITQVAKEGYFKRHKGCACQVVDA